MTDGLTYRGQDSISTLYFIFSPFWRRLYCFHKVICQPLSRWEEAKLLKKGAKGGCFSEANDKMNQARWNNSCDMNNDAIMMLCRHCHGNKILSSHHTSCLFATEANLKEMSQYHLDISEPARRWVRYPKNQTLCDPSKLKMMGFLRGLRCIFIFKMYIRLILSEICSFDVDGDPKLQQSVGWIRVSY